MKTTKALSILVIIIIITSLLYFGLTGESLEVYSEEPATLQEQVVEDDTQNMLNEKSDEEQEGVSEWCWSYIRCSSMSDVTIVRDGQVVANTANGTITSIDPNIQVPTDKNDEKDIVTPCNEDYKVIIETADNGIMSVTQNVSHKNATDAKPTESNESSDYDVKKGDVYEIDQKTGGNVVLVDRIDQEAELKEIGDDGLIGNLIREFGSGFVIIGATIIFLVLGVGILQIGKKLRRNKRKTSNGLEDFIEK